jgi:hypothetical protein
MEGGQHHRDGVVRARIHIEDQLAGHGNAAPVRGSRVLSPKLVLRSSHERRRGNTGSAERMASGPPPRRPGPALPTHLRGLRGGHGRSPWSVRPLLVGAPPHRAALLRAPRHAVSGGLRRRPALARRHRRPSGVPPGRGPRRSTTTPPGRWCIGSNTATGWTSPRRLGA